MTDQFILNSLRVGIKVTGICALGISMKRVMSLYRRGQISRHQSGEMRGVRYQKFYLYRTVVSDDFPMPFQCTGAFCHARNIHGDRQHKLCPPCRRAKLRHNKTERSRPGNVHRANRTRQLLRYNRSVERFNARGGVGFRPESLRGLRLFNRLSGMFITDGRQ